MLEEDLQEQVGIAQIIFGAAGIESLPKACRAFGVNRKKHEVFVLAQSNQERTTTLFQGDGDLLVGKAGAQVIDPLGQRFWSLFKSAALDEGALGGRQAQGVFLVCPVQANEGAKLQSCCSVLLVH